MAEWPKALHPAMAGQAARSKEGGANIAGVKLESMAYIYILQDKISRKYYTGSCLELSKRIQRHRHHTGGQTTKNGNWILVCYKMCEDIIEARRIEKLVKSYKGGNAFKKIIQGGVQDWVFVEGTSPRQGGASC